MPSKQQNSQPYSAKNIPKLSPREHVRRRPGMYVGGTDMRGIHQLIWQTVEDILVEVNIDDNPCDIITITVLSNQTVRIADNGLGIPLEQEPKLGLPMLEFYLTQLGCDRHYIFDQHPLHYRHVGVMGINALSSECVAEVKRDGYLWRQTYAEGSPTSGVDLIRPLEKGEATGTSIIFTPDPTIFDDDVRFDMRRIMARCRELSYLQPNANFIVEQDESLVVYHRPDGIVDMVRDLNKHATGLHPTLYHKHHINSEQNSVTWDITLEIALQFALTDDVTIKSYVNDLETPEHGTHVDGIYDLLLSVIYGTTDVHLQDPLAGLTAVISLRHPDPHFESSTRIRLENPEIQAILVEAFEQLVADNKNIFAKIQGYLRH